MYSKKSWLPWVFLWLSAFLWLGVTTRGAAEESPKPKPAIEQAWTNLDELLNSLDQETTNLLAESARLSAELKKVSLALEKSQASANATASSLAQLEKQWTDSRKYILELEVQNQRLLALSVAGWSTAVGAVLLFILSLF